MSVLLLGLQLFSLLWKQLYKSLLLSQLEYVAADRASSAFVVSFALLPLAGEQPTFPSVAIQPLRGVITRG